MKKFQIILLFITLSISVTSSFAEAIFIGDHDSSEEHPIIPLMLESYNSYTQSIYHEDEIGITGYIYELEYYVRTLGILTSTDVIIYMASVTYPYYFGLNTHWIPIDQFTVVYEGSIASTNPNSEFHSINIRLDEPFLYEGGNLVICFWSKINNHLNASVFKHHRYNQNPLLHRSLFRYNNTIDPENPIGGLLNNTVPNISLFFSGTNRGSLSGTVTINDEPLPGVNIVASSIDWEGKATTNIEGEYNIRHVSVGEYTVTATKIGYYDVIIENVPIESDETTEINIEIELSDTYMIMGKIISSAWNEPLFNVNLRLTGYVTTPIVYTDLNGLFTIEGAYVNRDYTLEISTNGHHAQHININNFEDINLGEIMLFEIAHPPKNIITEDMVDYIKITWESASTSIGLIYYNIYISNINVYINANKLELLDTNIVDTVYLDYSKNTRDDGIYTYHVRAVYTNNNISELTNSRNTPVYPNGYIYLGDANSTITTNISPFIFTNRNSISQTLYLNDEINSEGVIRILKYYFNNFNVDIDIPVKIWMANVTESFNNFPNNTSWIPYSDFFLVYEGFLSVPQEMFSYVYFDLDEPFAYDGENLVIMTQRQYVINDVLYLADNDFHATDFLEENRVIYRHTGSASLDPEISYGTGTTRALVPNIVLSFNNDGYGALSGEVTHNGIPLTNAKIYVNKIRRQAISNNDGYYYLKYIPEGFVDITVSCLGYYNSYINDIKIENAETTTLNINLTPLSQVKITGSVAAISDRHCTDGVSPSKPINGVPPSKHINGETPFVQNIEDALIQLTGYNTYETVTDSLGIFTFPSVYTPFTYTITITKTGYQSYINDLIEIGYSDINLGTIFLTENIVSITDPEIIPVEQTLLHHNFPNPFNPSTTIRFDLAEDGNVVIDIFNLKGQKVKTLIDSNLTTGRYSLEWNGTDNSDRQLASGVYFYQMRVNNEIFTKKMMLIK